MHFGQSFRLDFLDFFLVFVSLKVSLLLPFVCTVPFALCNAVNVLKFHKGFVNLIFLEEIVQQGLC